QTGGDEDRFVSGAADLKEDLALALQLNFLVVELARQQHAAVDGEELVGAEPVEFHTARLTRGCARLTRGCARLTRGGSRLFFAAVDGCCLHPVMSNPLIIRGQATASTSRTARDDII